MTNLFSSKPVVDKITELENKSEAAISIFRSTLENLNSINEEVTIAIAAKEESINQIKTEIATLSERQVKNKNFVSKLQEFFE